MKLSEVLNAERKRQEMTIYRLSALTGIDAGGLTKILDGRTLVPGWDKVVKIVSALGRDLRWMEDQLDAEENA